MSLKQNHFLGLVTAVDYSKNIVGMNVKEKRVLVLINLISI